MSNEAIGQPIENTSLTSGLGGSLAFSAGITTISGTTGSVVRNRGIRKALDATKNYNKVLRAYGQNASGDVFTKSLKTASNYEKYKDLDSAYKKLARKAAKRGASQEAIDNAKKAKDAFDSATKNLESGKDIAETAIKYASNKGLLQDTKTLFKAELKNKFVLGITIIGAVPRITQEVIPAFREKGFFEGIKTTAKVIVRTGADFISNAGFSAIGRAIGTTAGMIFGPLGSVVGGTMGDVIGSFFSMKIISKIFDKKENNQKPVQTKQEIVENKQAQEEPVSNTQEIVENEQVQEAPVSNTQEIAQPPEISTENKYIKTTNKYTGMTSRYKGNTPRKEFIA